MLVLRIARFVVCALPLVLVAATPAQQVSPAPENPRCPGRPAPALPGPGWTAEPVWEWRDQVHVEGTLGSGDGPYAVALDRQCNSYVTDSQHFRILKLTPDGTAAQWSMPGDRPAGESSSPHGVAVDGLGNVYVAEAADGRVQKFSSDGKSV